MKQLELIPKQITKPGKDGRSKWEVGHLIIYTSSAEKALEQYNLIVPHCPIGSPNPTH